MDTTYAKVQELANRAALAGENETAATLRVLRDERDDLRRSLTRAINGDVPCDTLPHRITAERDTLKALCVDLVGMLEAHPECRRCKEMAARARSILT